MTASAGELTAQDFGKGRLRLDGITRFSAGVLVFNVAVIAWGAFVRATGSGAGCGSHWPLCNGTVVPRAPRIETLIEFSHRLTSGLALVSVFALAYLVLRSRAPEHPARRPAIAAAILIVVEALLGAGLVLFGWVEQDASWGRVIALALHLINTFLLLSALTLTTWRLAGAPGNRWRNQGVEGALVWSMFGMVLLVGVTGAMTSLGDTLFPAASLSEGMRRDFESTSHFLERLRVLHPMLAVFTAIAIIRGGWLLTRRRSSPMTTRLVKLTSAMIIAQLLVGLLNFMLRAPVAMQLVHLAMADAVWICLVVTGAAGLTKERNS
jgi:heme A synthase